MSMTERIHHIEALIHQAEMSCGRQPGTIQLIAVSKGHSSQAILQAFAAGLCHFGESYWQEAQTKIQALSNLPLCWHFIGPIQSNKSKKIASHFEWVHSVSRSKIATLLHDERPASLPPLNVCIQVNFDDETTKAGTTPESVASLATFITQLPRLRLRGLMLIPKHVADEEGQYQSFLRLKALLESLNQQLNLNMDTLSMGMSDDFQAAIRAGSTMLRLGTAIFGERDRGKL